MERHKRTGLAKEYDLPDLGGIVKRELWMEKAACKGMDSNIFFPERGESTKPAKAICNDTPCPVKEECLDYAYRTSDNRNGVLGGMSGIERRVYKRTHNVTLWKAS